nr:MAG TPA: hypothetical protein [Caudoviricetes sp.]
MVRLKWVLLRAWVLITLSSPLLQTCNFALNAILGLRGKLLALFYCQKERLKQWLSTQTIKVLRSSCLS